MTLAQQRGQAAESAALAYLQGRGLVFCARNVRYRVGELDLVMRDGSTIVFVEVRYRSPSRFGGALATVHVAKQRRLIRAAQCWLLQHRPTMTPACRFDVVAQDGASIRWVRDAFMASGVL